MPKRNFDYNTRPTGKDIQPFVDEFLAQNNAKQWLDVNKFQRYRFYDSVIPRIKKFLKKLGAKNVKFFGNLKFSQSENQSVKIEENLNG